MGAVVPRRGASTAGCEHGVGCGGLVARTGAVGPQGPCGGGPGRAGRAGAEATTASAGSTARRDQQPRQLEQQQRAWTALRNPRARVACIAEVTGMPTRRTGEPSTVNPMPGLAAMFHLIRLLRPEKGFSGLRRGQVAQQSRRQTRARHRDPNVILVASVIESKRVRAAWEFVSMSDGYAREPMAYVRFLVI